MAFSLPRLRPQCLQAEAEQRFATRTPHRAHTATSTLLLPLHDQILAAQRRHQDDDVAVMSTSAIMAARPPLSTDQSLSEQHLQSVAMTVAVAAERMTGGKI